MTCGSTAIGGFYQGDFSTCDLGCVYLGDFDGDGDIDLDDYGHWPACMTGPNANDVPLGCEPFDFDGDTDVDLGDFQALQSAMMGV